MRTALLIFLRIVASALLAGMAAFLGYLGYMLALSKRARETAGWPEPSSP